MHTDFWNLWPEVISGREGDENEGSTPSGEGESGDEGEGDEETPEGSSENSSTESEGEPNEETSIEKLKTALAAERRLARQLDRENKRLKRTQGKKQEAETETVEELTARLQQEQAKAQRLAVGYRNSAVNNAIREAAKDLKFLDVTDAIDGVDRTSIVIDQDDEDPSDIDIDLDSVKKAVKALAKKKPHFLSRGTSDAEPTGSSFGGSKQKKTDGTDTLRELYPSL